MSTVNNLPQDVILHTLSFLTRAEKGAFSRSSQVVGNTIRASVKEDRAQVEREVRIIVDVATRVLGQLPAEAMESLAYKQVQKHVKALRDCPASWEARTITPPYYLSPGAVRGLDAQLLAYDICEINWSISKIIDGLLVLRVPAKDLEPLKQDPNLRVLGSEVKDSIISSVLNGNRLQQELDWQAEIYQLTRAGRYDEATEKALTFGISPGAQFFALKHICFALCAKKRNREAFELLERLDLDRLAFDRDALIDIYRPLYRVMALEQHPYSLNDPETIEGMIAYLKAALKRAPEHGDETLNNLKQLFLTRGLDNVIPRLDLAAQEVAWAWATQAAFFQRLQTPVSVSVDDGEDPSQPSPEDLEFFREVSNTWWRDEEVRALQMASELRTKQSRKTFLSEITQKVNAERLYEISLFLDEAAQNIQFHAEALEAIVAAYLALWPKNLPEHWRGVDNAKSGLAEKILARFPFEVLKTNAYELLANDFAQGAKYDRAAPFALKLHGLQADRIYEYEFTEMLFRKRYQQAYDFVVAHVGPDRRQYLFAKIARKALANRGFPDRYRLAADCVKWVLSDQHRQDLLNRIATKMEEQSLGRPNHYIVAAELALQLDDKAVSDHLIAAIASLVAKELGVEQSRPIIQQLSDKMTHECLKFKMLSDHKVIDIMKEAQEEKADD